MEIPRRKPVRTSNREAGQQPHQAVQPAETTPPPLYTKLNPDPDVKAIRLILISAGYWSDPIRCHLFETSIPTKRPYKALSYAWKNRNNVDDVAIQLNGRPYKVKANVYTAMRRLRLVSEPIEIWVDSLCINQQDDKERTHQVSMMRTIYERSSEVVIWLGESTRFDDVGERLQPAFSRASISAEGFKRREDVLARIDWDATDEDMPKLEAYLSSISSSNLAGPASSHTRDIFGAFCVIYLLSRQVPASEIWQLRHIDYSMPIIRGLYALMDQSWWRRAWVVQETVVAKTATVVYGKLSAPWTMFANAALEYDRTRLLSNANSVYPYLHDGQPLLHFSRILSEVELTRRQWVRQNPTSLLPLLRKFRSRDATDPRDKVFSLLGLVRSWGRRDSLIAPDYAMGVHHVYWETTTRLIEATRSLSVLSGTLQPNSMQWGQKPSWITDWSCPPEVHENIRLSNMALYNASRGQRGLVQVHGRDILETSGWEIDEVAYVDQELTLGSEGSTNRLRLIVSKWEAAMKEKGAQGIGVDEYIGGGTCSNAFWRLLCGDTEYVKSDTTQTGEDILEFKRATDMTANTYLDWRWVEASDKRRTSIVDGYWQETGGGDKAKGNNAFHYAIECASGFRTMYITKKGYVGTGPGNIRTRDKIFILLGSRVPLMLRPATAYHARCRLAPVKRLLEPGQDEQWIIPGVPMPMDVLDDPAFVGDTKKDIRSRLTKTEKKEKKVEASSSPPSKPCSATHELCYYVVGDCYVQGLMDGEGLSQAEQRGQGASSVFLV